jgi:itaconate CoA-transferase
VVSLEQAAAAPFDIRQLADPDDRVIKFERPHSGDFARCYDNSVRGQSGFVWLSRSKESFTLDVKTPAGREILEQLLPSADVLVQNLASGDPLRLGINSASLAGSQPEVIACSISGYGPDGPWAGRKAHDLLVQSETGLVSLTSGPGKTVQVGISIADIAAGMYGFPGILTALYRCATTGRISADAVSMFDALAESISEPAYYVAFCRRQSTRVGAQHPTTAPYGLFHTTGGDAVLLAIQNEREWRRFCEVMLDDRVLVDYEWFATNSASYHVPRMPSAW